MWSFTAHRNVPRHISKLELEERKTLGLPRCLPREGVHLNRLSRLPFLWNKTPITGKQLTVTVDTLNDDSVANEDHLAV